MAFYISRARVALIACIGVLSMLGGIVFIFWFGTPRGLERLHTYEIVGMLGLLFLPLLTVWALYADVKAKRAAAAQGTEEPAGGESALEQTGVDPHEDGQRSVKSWAGAGSSSVAVRAAVEGVIHVPRPGDDAGRERHRRGNRRPAESESPSERASAE